MDRQATLRIDGQELSFPLVEGREGERAVDFTRLRPQTGLESLDPGYANTASCRSAVTFIDGDKGIHR
jgi:citrate synthase